MARDDLYLARVYTNAGLNLWCMFDADHCLHGRPGETAKDLLARWNTHGPAWGRSGHDVVTVRYKGWIRPSELAMTVLRLKYGEQPPG